MNGMAQGVRRVWRSFGRELAVVIAAAALGALTGCDGFFVNNTTTGTGAGNTGNLVYAVNPTAGTLTGYSIGTNTLTSVAAPYTLIGVAPQAIAISRPNTFVYVGTQNGIYGYAISSNGTLTALAGGAALTVSDDVSLATSPDGQWLFGLDLLTLSIDEFQINTSTGALTQQIGASYSQPATGGSVVPTQIRVSPKGNYVVAALGNGGIVVYPLTTSTGVLSTGNQLYFSVNTLSDNGVAIDPTDTYLFVAQSGSQGGTGANGVYSYKLSSLTSGGSTALAPLVATGAGPGPIALNNAGTELYVGNRADNTISGFAVSAGLLAKLTGSPYAVGVTPRSFAMDSTGTYLLSGTSGNSTDISLFSFDPTVAGQLNSKSAISTGSDIIGAVIAVTH